MKIDKKEYCMIELIQLMAIVIPITCLFMLVKPTKKMTQQEKRYAVSNRAEESPEYQKLQTTPMQTVVKANGTEKHTHAREIPQKYINVNGEIVKRSELEKYQ